MVMEGNAEAVRRFYEAYNRRDWDALKALLDPDVEWFHTARDEHVRGVDAVVALTKTTADAFPDARVQLLAVHAAGEFVIAECVLARGGGRLKALHKASFCEISQYRDGRCIRGSTYADTLRVLLELGSGSPRELALAGLAPTGTG
jgi:ketosteroid isomerase-like protein